MKTKVWSLQADGVLAGLSTAASGLSSAEVEKWLGANSKSRLTRGNGNSTFRVFLRQFEGPIALLLLFAAAILLLM